MPTSRPLAIEATGLGKDYGATQALGQLDLSVPPGSIVGLLGPNGAGKTTAMLLLATLLTPSRGRASIFGHDCTRDRAAVRKRLGLVFQEASIDGLLTVEENLLFAARLCGLGGDAARRAVRDTIASTGLGPYASKPARQLSTGWRRLADLARAFLHRPDLLILDEPTVGLDPEHRDRAWHLVETERATRGVTILFSTHYLAEAERCDHATLLAAGREVASGTPAALKALVGSDVVEVDGPDAASIVPMLQQRVDVKTVIATGTSYRIGVDGPRERLAGLAEFAPRFQRFLIRPATLEDVYFAKTQHARREPVAAGGPR